GWLSRAPAPAQDRPIPLPPPRVGRPLARGESFLRRVQKARSRLEAAVPIAARAKENLIGRRQIAARPGPAAEERRKSVATGPAGGVNGCQAWPSRNARRRRKKEVSSGVCGAPVVQLRAMKSCQ